MCWGKLWTFQSMEATRKAFAMYEAEWHCKLDSLFSLQGDAGWFKKAPLWKAVGVFSTGTIGIKCFFLLSCLLLLGNHLHLDFASLFHMGKESCSSSCGPYRWHLFQLRVRGGQVNGVGRRSPRQPAPRGGKKGSQCQTDVYRKFSLQWISLLQRNNRRVWCCIIHASSLFWFYLWILANNRWLRPLLFWEIGRWKH